MRLEKRILIVDDDDAIRALLTTVLRKRGYLADAARNGASALEQLGDMSAAARPLVLVLTAGPESRRFDTSVVVGTMAKPFDIDLLVATVRSCIEVCEAREQSEPRVEVN